MRDSLFFFPLKGQFGGCGISLVCESVTVFNLSLSNKSTFKDQLALFGEPINSFSKSLCVHQLLRNFLVSLPLCFSSRPLLSFQIRCHSPELAPRRLFSGKCGFTVTQIPGTASAIFLTHMFVCV